MYCGVITPTPPPPPSPYCSESCLFTSYPRITGSRDCTHLKWIILLHTGWFINKIAVVYNYFKSCHKKLMTIILCKIYSKFCNTLYCKEKVAFLINNLHKSCSYSPFNYNKLHPLHELPLMKLAQALNYTDNSQNLQSDRDRSKVVLFLSFIRLFIITPNFPLHSTSLPMSVFTPKYLNCWLVDTPMCSGVCIGCIVLILYCMSVLCSLCSEVIGHKLGNKGNRTTLLHSLYYLQGVQKRVYFHK